MTDRYESLTDGIRVTVRPRFSLAQSDPAEGEFVFAYHVRMENLEQKLTSVVQELALQGSWTRPPEGDTARASPRASRGVEKSWD